MIDTPFYFQLDETIRSTRMLMKRSGLTPSEFLTDERRLFNLHCLWQHVYPTQSDNINIIPEKNVDRRTFTVLRELQQALSLFLQRHNTDSMNEENKKMTDNVCQLLNELTDLVAEKTSDQLRLIA